MEQGVLGSSLTATSRRGFLFSGRLGSSWLSHPFFTVWYADFKVYLSTIVTTIVSHTTLLLLLLFLTFRVLVANPKKTTLHGGQSLSRSAEQGKENKIKSLAAYPPTPPPTLLVRKNK